MMAYYKMKKALPASEFEDGGVPTFELSPSGDFSPYHKLNGNGFYVDNDL